MIWHTSPSTHIFSKSFTGAIVITDAIVITIIFTVVFHSANAIGLLFLGLIGTRGAC